MNYDNYINSKEWQNRRKELFAKRGKICERCGSDRRIHVHHGTYKNLGSELENELFILCKPCHVEYHSINKKPTIASTLKFIKHKIKRSSKKKKVSSVTENQKRLNRLNRKRRKEKKKLLTLNTI